jgi:hypothetical protein
MSFMSLILTWYDLNVEIKEDEKGVRWKYGQKYQWKIPLWSSWRMWEENTKWSVKEMSSEGVDRTDLYHNDIPKNIGIVDQLAPLKNEADLFHCWRFTAYQFVLAPSPSRLTTVFFLLLKSTGHSPCVPSSLMRGSVCVLWLCLALSNVRIAGVECYYKFFLVHCVPVLCQSRLCNAHHAFITYRVLQQQSRHLNGRKLDLRHV